MIFFISEKGGYDNFLKAHNDWIMADLEKDMRTTEKSDDYKAFIQNAVEGNKIIDMAKGVDAGVDPDADFDDVEGSDWKDVLINTKDLVKRLNSRS